MLQLLDPVSVEVHIINRAKRGIGMNHVKLAVGLVGSGVIVGDRANTEPLQCLAANIVDLVCLGLAEIRSDHEHTRTGRRFIHGRSCIHSGHVPKRNSQRRRGGVGLVANTGARPGRE